MARMAASYGDHFIRYTENKIKNLTSTAIAGYDDEDIYLSNFGVVTELDGTLSIDERRFKEYFAENPENFAAVTTSMIRTADRRNRSAPTDSFTPGVYGFSLSGGTATLTDSSTTANMSAAQVDMVMQQPKLAQQASCLTQLSQQSTQMSTWHITQTLSKYIDDVFLLNGDIDEKIFNLEDDLDSLVEEQEALDLQITNQRAIYVQKFTAMETVVSSFRKTVNFLII